VVSQSHSKTPKLHFLDSGLLAALTGVLKERITADRSALSVFPETFVYTKLLKQASWSHTACTITHYQYKSQHEVDLVIEGFSGDIVGLEVMARTTVMSGLKKLVDAERDRFNLGIVLYDGYNRSV
jgi:predicted AAA+ superfamily ATPase